MYKWRWRLFHGPVQMDIELQTETDDTEKAREKAWKYFYISQGGFSYLPNKGWNPKWARGSSILGFEKLEDTDTGGSLPYGQKPPQLTEVDSDQ